MALDGSLFTLSFEHRKGDSAILDLFPFHPASATALQPSPLYTLSRARGVAYNVQLTDYLTSIPLSSIAAPSSADKTCKIQLHNPDDAIILEKKGMTFRQEWRWTWQEQEYLIRRDGRAYIVEAIRKPDPEISIARYTPATKIRPAFLQIQDYNIQRLEVSDRRGLEVIILMAVCTLLNQEYDEKYKDGTSGNIYLGGIPRSTVMSTASDLERPPPQRAMLPIASNEISIELHTPNQVYVQHALRLMRQDEGGEGLHLIILKAFSPQVTPKAVQVAADIKLHWYRLEAVAKGRTLDPLPGSKSEIAEELYQYVRDPSLQNPTSSSSTSMAASPSANVETTGRRPRIKLDSPAAPPPTSTPSSLSTVSGSSGKTLNKQTTFLPPPSQLDIYLSKERIDEFEVARPSDIAHSLRQRPATPDTRTPTIPPKGLSAHHNQENGGGSEPTGAKKLFGRLGLRKNHAPDG